MVISNKLYKSNKTIVIGSKSVGYEKLPAWQLADELAWKVYLLTDKFPKEELYGIVSQLRRAILSVVLNIIEGHARNNRNEFRNFLRIALGSLAESDYLLKFSQRKGFITSKKYQEISILRESCGRVLWKLMKSQ